MTTFDKETFLAQEVEAGFDTSFARVPEGVWPAYIGDLDVVERGADTIFEVTWVIVDDRVKQALNMERPTCRQGIFLEFDAAGALLRGDNKNPQLGRLLEVADLNDPAKPLRLGMLNGFGPAMVKITHKPNKDDPDNPYANVTRVAKMESAQAAADADASAAAGA